MSGPTTTRRRRVRLSPLPPVSVSFNGNRAAEGPLTLGQLNILQWLSGAPEHFFATICAELEVGDATSVEDVAEAAAVLLGRHEGLRTTYTGGDRPVQRVERSGVLPLLVCSLGEGSWGPAEAPAVAQALIRWLRTQGSLGLDRLPVRMAVAVDAEDHVVACAAEISHLAVDYQAMELLKREFAELVRDRDTPRTGTPHQPLDQAALEGTPTGRRQAEVALCYWQDQLERMPHCLYAGPRSAETGESLAIELSSPAAALAVRRIAVRTKASRSSIVLAAICAVLAHRTGYRELVFPLLSSNRFDRQLASYVGTLAQGCVVTVEAGTGSFDALVKQTWAAVIESCRHGRYDAFKRVELGARIEHDRGIRFDYEPLFNNVAAESWSAVNAGRICSPEQVTAALDRTELRARPMPSASIPVRFDLYQLDGVVRLDLWNSGTDRVPRDEMESVLLAVERLLVAAAGADLDPTRMGELVGLDPIARGAGWALVDGCWVEIADVQRLLDAALGPATARIFPTAHGQPLVAYLAATPSVATPEAAHARCLAALPQHPTAMTPRHYVLCESAPANPANLTEWRSIITAGTGRMAPRG